MLTENEARARLRRLASRAVAGRKPRAVQRRRTAQPTTWFVPPPLTFVVRGRPQPKERARKGASGRFYTPPATVRFEAAVGLAGLIAMRAAAPARHHFPWPLHARYRVTVVVTFAKGQRADLDNVGKAVLDGLNHVLWHDDSQVRQLSLATPVARLAAPGTSITVEVLPSADGPAEGA